MTNGLSANTKAILLLAAPLIEGRASASQNPLTPGEYQRLAQFLRRNGRQPADLLGSQAGDLVRACAPLVDEERLRILLRRGFQLSQALERWQSRAIWVLSRADEAYPKRLKERLKENSPAVLYGCGDRGLLETGGLAVVGSRKVDDFLLEYAASIGKLAAAAAKTVVSGGAKGVDQAAMRGALEAGGNVIGVLADSLEKSVMNRENRDRLIEGRLVLVSPYDPLAGFNVGNAMSRNKLIYAFADAALVVDSSLETGGTWAGAVEQLKKFKFAPLYVRSTGPASPALEALKGKGALPWPDPQGPEEFRALLGKEQKSQETPIGLTDSQKLLDLEVNAYLEFKTDLIALLKRKISLTKAEIFKELSPPPKQANAWIKKLLEDQIVQKEKDRRHYILRQRALFDETGE